MQIAKSVNSENANISATRVSAQASTFMLLMCLWQISRAAYLYLKFPSTENSACVEPWHCTWPWQWSRRWAEQQEHQQTGECTGAACANTLAQQPFGRQSKMSPPKLSLEGWARRICQALKTEDSSLRKQLVQKYSFGWELSGKSRNKVRHHLEPSSFPPFSFQKLTKQSWNNLESRHAILDYVLGVNFINVLVRHKCPSNIHTCIWDAAYDFCY